MAKLFLLLALVGLLGAVESQAGETNFGSDSIEVVLAKTQTLLERIDGDKQAEAILDVAQVTEAKCSLEYVEKVKKLMSSTTGFQIEVGPYLAYYFGKQLKLCWPTFTANIRKAVDELSDSTRARADALVRGATNGKSDRINVIHYPLYNEGSTTYFAAQLPEFLRSKGLRPRYTMSFTIFKAMANSIIKKGCAEIASKIKPITAPLSDQTVCENSHLSDQIDEFTRSWLLKGKVCGQLMAAMRSGLAKALFYEPRNLWVHGIPEVRNW